MKYVVFFAGLWLACNEALDLDWSVIGLCLMALSGTLIVEQIKESMNIE